MNYLAIPDAWSYLSWAGLRPLTEMEFERAARDLAPDARTFPWGEFVSTDTVQTYSPPNEGGTCTRNYMNYNGEIVLTACQKVLDVGRYMSGDVYRTAAQTGASPYGIADMAGNVWNIVINCAWATAPGNGNGTVYWPGTWPTPGNPGTGIRGGSWYSDNSDMPYMRISDAYRRSWLFTNQAHNVGSRGARTP
jgi:formylglycine-generating enzyme required for sulfatase activity